MEIEIILGRPGAGKTGRLITLVNSYSGSALLISLENPPKILSERGLKDTVALYSPNEYELVTVESVIKEIKKVKATLVAIELLELVPTQIELSVLIEALEEVGVEHLVITSQLRRDGVCASKRRIDAIQAKHTVLVAQQSPAGDNPKVAHEE